MIKAIFFDRDGVLIKNYKYNCDTGKIKWLKGVTKTIKLLNSKKIKVIVVTNQSGIGRGYYSEQDLKKFHNTMNKHLKKIFAKIDKFYYCPYHPKASIKKYRKTSNDRKPGNGMITQALKNFNLDKSKCFMIGDQKSDFLSAKKTKIRFQYKKNYSLDIQVKKILNNY